MTVKEQLHHKATALAESDPILSDHLKLNIKPIIPTSKISKNTHITVKKIDTPPPTLLTRSRSLKEDYRRPLISLCNDVPRVMKLGGRDCYLRRLTSKSEHRSLQPTVGTIDEDEEENDILMKSYGITTTRAQRFSDVGLQPIPCTTLNTSKQYSSLPANISDYCPKVPYFPRYRRQYKVESIYVNDLYTLTYDEGETLESIKRVEVTYRRNDREEIRRKLAMGFDEDFERPLRKPSLQSRLQSGMNLQICFMNETASDCESQCSDTESTQDRIEDNVDVTGSTTSLNIKGSTPIPTKMRKSKSELTGKEPMDFFARQAQLQAEARMALAQAKEMARMQMEIEKQSKKKSPIADIVRESMLKIGVPFPDSKRRVSRQILTDMNIAQLQVIVNDLHTQIESLNEDLVTMLLERDDLHMEQDSMLVDIEDLTKHMGAKEMSLREQQSDSVGETQSLQNARCSPKMTASPKRPRSKSLKLTGSPRK